MSKRKLIPTHSNRSEAREETKLILEFLSAFHDTGASIATRTIYMGSEQSGLEGETGTDAKMAEKFIKNLHVFEYISHEPIRVISNNLGGDVYHGLAIYDAIKESPCKIEMFVRGYAMSMGSIILQAADRRVMGPSSKQLVHDGEMGMQAHARTFIKWAEETKRLNDWCTDMYLKRIREKHPRFSREKLLEMLDHDHIMTAQQSVELGLADEIG